jgi:hypothetical protein
MKASASAPTMKRIAAKSLAMTSSPFLTRAILWSKIGGAGP